MAKKARKQNQPRETAIRFRPAPPLETYRAAVTAKGQVVIPAALRKKYGLTSKTQLVISEKAGRITLKPITPEAIEPLRGKYKGSGVLKAPLEERAKDHEHDDSDSK